MNCPYCNFHFKKLAINDDAVPSLAPLVCESCGEISLFTNRTVRKVNDEELAAIKTSPAYKEHLQPIQQMVKNRESIGGNINIKDGGSRRKV
jgi:hypothetical protein